MDRRYCKIYWLKVNARPIDKRCWKIHESNSNATPLDTRYRKIAWLMVNARPMDRRY